MTSIDNVKKLLNEGEIERAKRAYDDLDCTQKDPIIEWEILDALEAIYLGESVYPAGVPMNARWNGPRLVERTGEEASVIVGRVVDVRAEKKDIIYAAVEIILSKDLEPGKVPDYVCCFLGYKNNIEWLEYFDRLPKKDEFFEIVVSNLSSSSDNIKGYYAPESENITPWTNLLR